MITINTPGMVEAFGKKASLWLFRKQRANNIELLLPGTKVTLSKRAMRAYLDSVLTYLAQGRVGRDSEVDLGYYTVLSSKDKDYVVVRRSTKRLPKRPYKYAGWVEWDITVRDKYTGTSEVKELYMQHTSKIVVHDWIARSFYRFHKDSVAIAHVNVSILSQVLLQCLFDPLGEVNLLSRPLPTHDLRCRVGGFHLLYDSKDKEWRIWRK